MLQFNLCYSLKKNFNCSFYTKVICAFLQQIKLEETIGYVNLSIYGYLKLQHSPFKGLIFYRDPIYTSLTPYEKHFLLHAKTIKRPVFTFFSMKIKNTENLFRTYLVKEEMPRMRR